LSVNVLQDDAFSENTPFALYLPSTLA